MSNPTVRRPTARPGPRLRTARPPLGEVRVRRRIPAKKTINLDILFKKSPYRYISYKEAKAALEAADGSVVDAIINLEEVIDSESKKTVGQHGAAIADINYRKNNIHVLTNN